MASVAYFCGDHFKSVFEWFVTTAALTHSLILFTLTILTYYQYGMSIMSE
jgi:hypothetical protein